MKYENQMECEFLIGVPYVCSDGFVQSQMRARLVGVLVVDIMWIKALWQMRIYLIISRKHEAL